MAYATLADVEQLNTARTYTGSSKPTTNQVIDWLEQTAGVLNGALKEQGYSLPIATTATGALKTLEHYNALGAAAFVEQGSPSSDRRKEAMDLWQGALKMLRDGAIELEADQDETAAAPRSSFGSSPTPFFSRDMEL